MYLEIFLADFAAFRVFGGISRDFAEMPEFRGSATARNIRSPAYNNFEISLVVFMPNIITNHAITYTNVLHFCKEMQCNAFWDYIEETE